jgi:hypothetical protein
MKVAVDQDSHLSPQPIGRIAMPQTRLGRSVARVHPVLAELLGETTARRTLDLSNLGPLAQTDLILARAQQVIPGADALTEAIAGAAARRGG